VGKLLRLYDLGRKKLLRKCENKHIPHMVVDIKTIGERIIVSDVQVVFFSIIKTVLLSTLIASAILKI
jgi:splicing factor 3B subunit 3